MTIVHISLEEKSPNLTKAKEAVVYTCVSTGMGVGVRAKRNLFFIFFKSEENFGR